MTELMKRYEKEVGWTLEEAKKQWKTFLFWEKYIEWLENQLSVKDFKPCPKCAAEVIVDPYVHDLEQQIEIFQMRYEHDLTVRMGVKEEDLEWAKTCLRECSGITKEALDKGVVSFALDWILKHEILDPFTPYMPRKEEIPNSEATFMGVRVFKEDV